MSGVLRSLPVLFPRVVTTTIGRPLSRNVLARRPPEASYSATCSRTQPYGLGSYSPSSGDMGFTYPEWTIPLRELGVEELADTRFAISPSAETVYSLWAIH